MLPVAAILAVLIGAAHSLLGERFILIRLFRRPLPPLFGNDEFTRKTLRFAWHVTTVAWWGFAAILYQLSSDVLTRRQTLFIVGATFGVTAVIALLGSRGKHLSWIVFGIISVICLAAGNTAVTESH